MPHGELRLSLTKYNVPGLVAGGYIRLVSHNARKVMLKVRDGASLRTLVTCENVRREGLRSRRLML